MVLIYQHKEKAGAEPLAGRDKEGRQMERREQSKRGNGKLKMEEKKKKQRVKWGENVGEWGGERERGGMGRGCGCCVGEGDIQTLIQITQATRV